MVLLALCLVLSGAGVFGMTAILALSWDDVLPVMRAVWVGYVLLLIATSAYALYDFSLGIRLRALVANLAVFFGVPIFVIGVGSIAGAAQ